LVVRSKPPAGQVVGRVEKSDEDTHYQKSIQVGRSTASI
jgi:hypothetical protein